MPKASSTSSRTAPRSKPATAAQLAAVNFDPCDRDKYPPVDARNFEAGMSRMAEIGYAAHVLAYLTKDQLIQTLGTFEGQEAPAMMDDFMEARETLSELCRTMEAVELRLIIAGACLEVADAQT